MDDNICRKPSVPHTNVVQKFFLMSVVLQYKTWFKQDSFGFISHTKVNSKNVL